MARKIRRMAKPFRPGDPTVLADVQKLVAANRKKYKKSKTAAVAVLKREGILTKSGRVAARYK